METITAEAMAPVNKKKGLGLPPKKIVNANGTQMPIANAPKKLLINQAPQIQAIHRMGSKNDAIGYEPHRSWYIYQKSFEIQFLNFLLK